MWHGLIAFPCPVELAVDEPGFVRTSPGQPHDSDLTGGGRSSGFTDAHRARQRATNHGSATCAPRFRLRWILLAFGARRQVDSRARRRQDTELSATSDTVQTPPHCGQRSANVLCVERRCRWPFFMEIPRERRLHSCAVRSTRHPSVARACLTPGCAWSHAPTYSYGCHLGVTVRAAPASGW